MAFDPALLDLFAQLRGGSLITLKRDGRPQASVVIHAWSGPISNARSLVILPLSTVSTHTFSRASPKRSTSGVPSNRPR